MNKKKWLAVILSFAPGIMTISCDGERGGPDADAELPADGDMPGEADPAGEDPMGGEDPMADEIPADDPQSESCDGVTCSGHGDCVVTDGGAECQCETGYHAVGLACEPFSDESLLAGMTPGDYTLPEGWTLVRVQDFEGDCPSDEWCGLSNGSVSGGRPHGDGRSVEGEYTHDQNSVGWNLEAGVAGGFTELYLSFFEFIEPQALFNDEFFLAHFMKRMGDEFQEVVLDWFWAPGFNQPVATLYVVSQATGGSGGVTNRAGAWTDTVPSGAWVQWEIWYRPNTPDISDGFVRVYRDGALFGSVENENVNGTVDMTDMMVQAGGLYTKLVWMTDYPTCSVPSGCSSGPGEGTDACTAEMGWWGQPFSDPVCNPIDPPLPSFRRFFDDIIVMKR